MVSLTMGGFFFNGLPVVTMLVPFSSRPGHRPGHP